MSDPQWAMAEWQQYCQLGLKSVFTWRHGGHIGDSNNETAAMLVSETNPEGVEFFSYVNAFFCANKFA